MNSPIVACDFNRNNEAVRYRWLRERINKIVVETAKNPHTTLIDIINISVLKGFPLVDVLSVDRSIDAAMERDAG